MKNMGQEASAECSQCCRSETGSVKMHHDHIHDPGSIVPCQHSLGSSHKITMLLTPDLGDWVLFRGMHAVSVAGPPRFYLALKPFCRSTPEEIQVKFFDQNSVILLWLPNQW